MYSKALLAVLALSAGSISHVAAQLQCGDITDLVQYCKSDCGDSEYKSAECGAYGADCYCINKNGEVENTNIEAPIECQGTNVEITCAKECGKVQNIEDFSCQDKSVNCVCAADDGIKGIGDDISEELADYADQQDDAAQHVAEDLQELPTPIDRPSTADDSPSVDAMAPASLDIPSIVDNSLPLEAMAPAASTATEASLDENTSSSMQTTVGSFVLAAAFGLVLA